jgi:hypothetical protein
LEIQEKLVVEDSQLKHKDMIHVKIYKAKLGAQFPKDKAQEIGEEIDTLKKDGKVTAEQVLEKARNKNSVMHPYFDWDKKSASYKWNLHQARMILNSIEVVYINEETDEEEHHPMYINIKETQDKSNDDEEKAPKERAYVDFETVGKNEDYRQQALADALQQVIHWKERYEWLEELAGIVKEIKKLE